MNQLSTYSEAAVVAQLRPPCDYSCQKLIYQMYNTKDWQSMFDYQTIIRGGSGGDGAGRAAGPSGSGFSATAKAGSSTGPGTKAGVASSKAGKIGVESGFQASRFRISFLD